ncbi:MAG: D-alanyl-D-alanine carboxypeptidase/D-alanyl-D-alanine-endopeptidase [Acidobacteriota bacterium]|nr:D-alanyl-D-alanine carboxypeptidase/D-alanyl-D-alanine-endopeptidase [Acidobacteriota bacterium]
MPCPDRRGVPSHTRGPAAAAGLLILALVTACAHRAPTITPSPARPSHATGLRTLPADLDRLLAAPAFAHGIVAAVVEEAASGRVLYARHADTLLLPASNMKIVTLAAASATLGWTFTYETKLLTTGPVEDGTLNGDLVIVGSGDPTLDGRDPSTRSVLADWADALWQQGIRRITGRVIGDGRALAPPPFGPGWAWDDLVFGFAAPVSGLQYHDNLIDLRIQPGAAPGDPVTVTVTPDGSGLTVDNVITTGTADASPLVLMHRQPGTNDLRLSGTLPAGGPAVARTAAVPDPPALFARSLRAALVARGIAVDQEGLDLADAAPPPALTEASTLIDYRSPPLSSLAAVMMKVSENLYAETLLRTIGLVGGQPPEPGPQRIGEVLTGWGFTPDDFVIADGSGLSRYNLLTASLLAGVLQRMRQDPAFVASLPVAGVDGTLAHRMDGTPARARVLAKTGSMTHVRALSGYVTTEDGRQLVFSILANNYDGSPAAVDAAIDAAVIRLAAVNGR